MNPLPVQSESPQSPTEPTTPPKKIQLQYGGHHFTKATCFSKKTLFVIAGIAGAVIFTLGLLALAGYLAPDVTGTMTGTLNQINQLTTLFALKLSTDVLTVALFGLGTGAALTLSGFAGVFSETCKESYPSTPHDPEVS